MTKVGEELVALRDGDGIIYPATVVDWARDHPESALHRQFEWDLERAAREHWLYRARQLISVHVRSDDGHRTTIALQIDASHGGGYRQLDDVLSSAELRRAAVEQAVGELVRWKDRNSHLRQELHGIFRSIDRVERVVLARDEAA